MRADVPVDLELVLAVDVSGSVDATEAWLQREGYVEALVNPKVVKAIQAGIFGRIAMTYLEWGGVQHKGTSKNAIFAHRRFRIGLTIC